MSLDTARTSAAYECVPPHRCILHGDRSVPIVLARPTARRQSK